MSDKLCQMVTIFELIGMIRESASFLCLAMQKGKKMGVFRIEQPNDFSRLEIGMAFASIKDKSN